MSDPRTDTQVASAVREKSSKPRLVGRGRSGAVYLDHDTRGRRIARKIFRGERLSALVLYLTTGADNPYGWNRDAVRSAVCRRRILRILVRYWFGDRLRLPRTSGSAWNTHFRAYELRAEFIRAKHLPLRYTSEPKTDDPWRELTHEIMRPLQRHLIEAGFDGLVWQAGFGNPVAGSNFMSRQRVDGRRTWFWIDTESGVPALFPLNVWRLVSFYLPRSVFHRRPLFDDVDVPKLRNYVSQHAEHISARLGDAAVPRLNRLIAELGERQAAWKSLNRTQRGILSFAAKGRLTHEQARWFQEHPGRWQAYLAKNGCRTIARLVRTRIRRLARGWSKFDVRTALERVGAFAVSERYRRFLSRRFVWRRIRAWRERQFLSRDESRRLRGELRDDQASTCITGFGVHVAIKPLVKIVEWWLLPVLFVLGLVSGPVFALLVSTGGGIGRTLYTLPQFVRAAVSRQRLPWLALLLGVFPFVGTVAYPMQLVLWSADTRRRLPGFLVYDTFASLGRGVPIWGGVGSLLETWANRLPDLFLRPRRRANGASKATEPQPNGGELSIADF